MPATRAIATPTPLAPRTGDRAEVRLGIFGVPNQPWLPNLIGDLANKLGSDNAVGTIKIRVVPVPYTGWPNDLDTQGIVPAQFQQLKGPAWQLSVALMSDATPQYVPDVIVFDRLDQLRYAADHHLLRPLESLLGAVPPVSDAWPGAFDVARYRNHIWALPLAIQPLVLTYQPSLFGPPFVKQRVALPDHTWDWQHLLGAAKALTTAHHLEWQAPGQKGGQFGFDANAPDTLALLVWQAGGDVVSTVHNQISCGLQMPNSIDGETFYFDLVHRDEVSPSQAAAGTWYESAAMQFGPGNSPNIAVPPKGKQAVSGYAFDASGPCLALTARCADAERAYEVAAVLTARIQGAYDWPISQSEARKRSNSSAQAAVAVQALTMVHPPGRYGDVRAAIEEHVARPLITEVATPDVAILSGQSLVEAAAKSGCIAVQAALRSPTAS